MQEENYYELLQVQPTADLEVIRAAYRSLARRSLLLNQHYVHPGRA